MSREPDHAPHPPDDEPPPILGSWRRVYIFVVCYLALVIGAFYIFARALNS